jgi:hypothetical protein
MGRQIFISKRPQFSRKSVWVIKRLLRLLAQILDDLF